MPIKKINTTVKTGDRIKDTANQRLGRVGLYGHGKITIYWSTNKFSGTSEQISTRALNKKLEAGDIVVLSLDADLCGIPKF